MAVLRCQACGKPNPDFLEKCQYCEARLTPAQSSAADDTVVRAPGDTLRCQACGRSNPTDRVNCQYCEARLRPLEATPPAAAAPAETPADPLARLRATQKFDAEADQPEPDQPTEAPPASDWMSRLRGVGAAGPSDETLVPPARGAASPSEPDWLFAEGEAAPAETAPDWLRDEPPPPADAPHPGSEDELPDWLANLRSTTLPPSEPPAADEPAPLPEPLAPEGGDELPDWLKPLAPEPAPAAEPTRGPRKKMTDWLNAPSSAPAAPSPEPPAPEPPAPEPSPEPPAPPADPVQPTDQTLVPPSRPRRKKMTDWLTPPDGGLPPQIPAPAPLEPETELPDWLKAMQPAEEVPDWLRDVASAPRSFNRPSTPLTATPEQADEPADPDVPDWLRAIQATAKAPAAPEPPEQPDPPQAEAPVVAPTPEAELPDWLKALRASPPAEEEPAPHSPLPAAQRQQELPGWLKAATGMLPPEPGPAPAELAGEAPAAGADQPWLQPEAEDEPAPEPEPPAAAPGEYELPDWLRPSPEALAAAEAEQAAEAAEDPAAITAAELARAEEELPDWLRNLPAASEQALDEVLPEPPAVDIPAWLRPPGTPPAPPEPDDSLMPQAPNWLRDLQAAEADSPTLPTAEQAADLPDLDDETLAWLSASVAAREEEAALAEPDALGGAPEWLDELQAAGQVVNAPAQADDDVAAAEPTAAEDMPDWLKALRGVPEEATPQSEPMPDWLRALRGIPPASVTTITPGEPAPAQARESEPEIETGGEPEAAAAGEAGADEALPAWLAAMRPSGAEHPADAEADAYEESVGVLAGMRGVLRAEPTVAQPRRSAAPVQGLVVGEAHAKNAQLLSALLDEEAAPRPLVEQPARFGRAARYVERWLVFLVLAAAILVPQFVLPDMFAAPTTISREAQSAFNAVNLAPMNQPALVVFDYDPAQHGELGPGAVTIVTHLMSRGVPVVAVSTRPLGAAVAHNVLQQVAAEMAARVQVSYTHGSQYLNLGYISGGPVGLLQFAAAPESVFQADFTGAGPRTALWTQPALRGVDGLNDFGLMVLITAAPDDTRAWIEQSQRYAAGIPRLAVVSAGAEPMVRPYSEGEAPQLDGLVAGLVGAAQYEQQAGLPGVASRHWSALGGGLWAALLLIAGGNAVYAALSVFQRRRRR